MHCLLLPSQCKPNQNRNRSIQTERKTLRQQNPRRAKHPPWGSNRRPQGQGPCALPTELGGLCFLSRALPFQLQLFTPTLHGISRKLWKPPDVRHVARHTSCLMWRGFHQLKISYARWNFWLQPLAKELAPTQHIQHGGFESGLLLQPSTLTLHPPRNPPFADFCAEC